MIQRAAAVLYGHGSSHGGRRCQRVLRRDTLLYAGERLLEASESTLRAAAQLESDGAAFSGYSSELTLMEAPDDASGGYSLSLTQGTSSGVRTAWGGSDITDTQV